MSDPGTLVAEGCGVQLGGRTLLSPTTLTIRPGAVTGLLGHNGSGKTTLLRCLARQLEPTWGHVALDGRRLDGWGARPFARRVAYLPQQLPVATGLLGREVVALGRYPWHGPLGRIGAADRAAVDAALQMSGSDVFAERLADSLSGGERQRLWIAATIAQESGFLLLDEPLAALDLVHQFEIMTLLRELARSRHVGVVLVVHDINIAVRFCDHLVALRNGAVIASGHPHDIMQPGALETIFGLRMRVLAEAGLSAPIAVPA